MKQPCLREGVGKYYIKSDTQIELVLQLHLSSGKVPISPFKKFYINGLKHGVSSTHPLRGLELRALGLSEARKLLFSL